MKVALDKHAKMPTKAHEQDAGWDLYCKEDAGEVIVPPHGSAIFDSGVHIALHRGTAGLLVSKSGLNVKHDITSTGLIDSGYTGSICVKLYNQGDTPYTINGGEKISQLLIIPYYEPELVLVDALDATERGSNGFGSSGK